MKILKGRRKSKTNPKGICFSCNQKIKNKGRSSKYCKECGLVKEYLHKKVWACISRYKYENPEYKITSRLNIKIKK